MEWSNIARLAPSRVGPSYACTIGPVHFPGRSTEIDSRAHAGANPRSQHWLGSENASCERGNIHIRNNHRGGKINVNDRTDSAALGSDQKREYSSLSPALVFILAIQSERQGMSGESE